MLCRFLIFFNLLFTSFSIFSQNNIIFGSKKSIVDNHQLNLSPQTALLEVDLNQDGKQDILFYGKGVIGWHQNLGGTFSTAKILSRDVLLRGYLAIADLDNDGDVDIAGYSFNADLTVTTETEVFWMQNNGFGDFGEKTTIFQEFNPNALGIIKIADLAGDGFLDIITAHGTNGEIAWYSQSEMNIFSQKQVLFIQDKKLLNIEVADLNGDSFLDLIGSGWDDELFWVQQLDGQGNFGEKIVLHYQETGYSYQAIPFDLDTDGDMDLIAIEDKHPFEHHRIVCYKNNGLGNFSPPTIIYPNGFDVHSLMLSDVDVDGDLDLVAMDKYGFDCNSRIYWFPNEDGLGDFGSQAIIANSAIPNMMTKGDFDNDGDEDFAVHLEADLVWYENFNDSHEFSTEKIISQNIKYPIKAIPTDLNKDQNIDFIIGSLWDKISLLKNREGVGTIFLEEVIDRSICALKHVSVGDLDGDSDEDLIFLKNNNQLIWRENIDGLGTFNDIEHLIFESSGVQLNFNIISRDLDMDGDLDILGISPVEDNVFWFENINGTGDFSNRMIIIQGDDFGEEANIADFDNDGDWDIYVNPGFQWSKLQWYENTTGDFSNWQLHEIDSLNSPIKQIVAKDLDRDGDLDFVVSDKAFPSQLPGIYWYENIDGEGHFPTQKKLVTSPFKVNCFLIEDFNKDGIFDLVFTKNDSAQYEKYLYLFQGITDSIGFFPIQNHKIDPTINVILSSLDINSDGYKDIVVNSTINNEVFWLPNISNYPSISGRCFMDFNQNKIMDSDEFGFAQQKMKIEPQAETQFANHIGNFQFIVSEGNFTIAPTVSEDWFISTDSVSFHLSVTDSIFSNLDFGFAPFIEQTKVIADISSGPTRCGFTVPFWITYENIGTTLASGFLTFDVPPLATFIEATPVPDSISNNTYFWSYQNLPPTYSENIEVFLQMPGVQSLGVQLEFQATTLVIDSLGILQECQVYKYPTTINCAYDPNDKQVNPMGFGTNHLTLFEEELDYTIRFQNTGTDTAFTVRIEDQLDEDLDFSTFQILAASHAYSVKLSESGNAEFLFENILLPDSTTNEPRSHGFIKYRITPKEPIAENTPIHNIAHIFFDFNPPITTNTTLNTLVSEIVNVKNNLSKIDVVIAPNPFDEKLVFQIDGLSNKNFLQLELLDIKGNRIFRQQLNQNSTIQINTEAWPPGIYFYQIKSDGEILKVGKVAK